jgi:hypothetical protein
LICELEEAARLKKTRRAQEIEAVLGSVTAAHYQAATTTVKADPKYYPAASKLVTTIETDIAGPSRQDLDSVIALVQERIAISARIEEERRRRASHLSAETVQQALRRLYGPNKATDRSRMSCWRDLLLDGTQTMEAFFKEARRPTMSHSLDDCGGCGKGAIGIDRPLHLAQLE